MCKLANIVTSAKPTSFSEIFNVVKSYDDIIDGLPTIIIGWGKAKDIIPNVDILNKRYGDTWWTFSKTERRCDYEEDIVSFYEFSVKTLMDKIKYVYVDFVNYRLVSIKKMVKFLKDASHKTVFLTKGNNFMFVYSKKYNTVFGISLSLCEYVGIERKKVIRLVRNGYFIKDTSFIDNDMRRIIGSNTHYILPLCEYFKKQ